MVALIVLLTIITFLTVDYFVQRQAEHKVVAAVPRRAPAPAVAAAALEAPPADVFLAPGHSWVKIEPAGALRWGVAPLPVRLLGGVDHVELLPAGTAIRRGDPVAVLRRGARALRLRAPVDGVVTAVNAALASEPQQAHGDPFGQGWLYRVSPAKLGPALRDAFIGEEARTWMRQELGRLRDALSSLANRGQPAWATLADGGLPAEGLAGILTEPEWEELAEELFSKVSGSER